MCERFACANKWTLNKTHFIDQLRHPSVIFRIECRVLFIYVTQIGLHAPLRLCSPWAILSTPMYAIHLTHCLRDVLREFLLFHYHFQYAIDLPYSSDPQLATNDNFTLNSTVSRNLQFIYFIHTFYAFDFFFENVVSRLFFNKPAYWCRCALVSCALFHGKVCREDVLSDSLLFSHSNLLSNLVMLPPHPHPKFEIGITFLIMLLNYIEKCKIMINPNDLLL